MNKAELHIINNIKVLSLSGDNLIAMGEDYGRLLAADLKDILAILKNYYISEHKFSYEQMLDIAEALYLRYPYSWRNFIKGISTGSGLSLEDCKILNAMESLALLFNKESLGQCSFIYLPDNQDNSSGAFYGRIYDYQPPFNLLAKYLLVTIINEPNKLPVAIIALAGQIYCATGVSKNGLFLALNNGMPSGGYFVDTSKQSLLINLLRILQESENIDDITSHLNALQADFSLIINYGDGKQARSHEFSSTRLCKNLTPSRSSAFISTNFFLSPSWQDIPEPSDQTTWNGVSRRNNLISSVSKLDYVSLPKVLKVMDKVIADGGAVSEFTIYQVVFEPKRLQLYLKTKHTAEWTLIELAKYF